MQNRLLFFCGPVLAIILATSLIGCTKATPPPRPQAEDVPSDFDWRTYLKNYEELEEKGIDTEQKAKEHWLTIGKKKGLSYHDLFSDLPSDFDWETYVSNYEDLRNVKTRGRAAKHWLSIGKKEGRTYKYIPASPSAVPYMPWLKDSQETEEIARIER